MNPSLHQWSPASRCLTGRFLDTTPRALIVAMCVLAVFGGSFAHAQDVELPEKSKEPFIGRIMIRGNVAFSNKDLKRQMMTVEPPFFVIFSKPRLDREKLRRDVAAMQAFYRANGYLEAEVRLEKLELVENGAFVDIIIGVDEGEPTRVESVSFEGTGPVTSDRLSKNLRLKQGVPFNPTLVNADIYTMKRQYFEQGYLGVEIEDSVVVEGKVVRLHYEVDPGPVVTIRRIAITGNRLTKDHIIERELAFEEGEVFRLSKAIETQRNLFETGLFTEAEILPENLDVRTRTVDVTVRVRERKSAYFEFGFGVGNVLGSRITGEWGDRNLFGRGRKLVFKAEYSFDIFEGGVVDFSRIDPRVKYYRYDAEFGQRRVFGSKLGVGVNGYIEKDATVEAIIIRTRGLAVGGGLHVSPRTDAAVRLSDERIEREAPDVGSEKSHSRLISSTLSHDTRDFILDPRRGGYRDLRLELAGGILGGDNDFYTLNTSLQKYWPKTRNSALAVRARIGYADAYGASKNAGVPVENRYFTGGGNSVRGFEENSLGPTDLTPTASGEPAPVVVGGRFLLVGNVELRFPVPYFWRYRFSGAVFADAGNVWRSLQSVDLGDFRLVAPRDEVTDRDFRYSLGVGLRYNTPVGPIRLDFAAPIKKDETDKFGRFHLSLGQIF
jgi:outer membrane protein insertion porin family